MSMENLDHIDRKIVIHGAARTIAMSKIIPEGWEYVRIVVKDRTKDEIQLVIKRLVGDDKYASNKAISSRHRQDT